MQNRLYSKSVQSVQCYYAALDLKKKKRKKSKEEVEKGEEELEAEGDFREQRITFQKTQSQTGSESLT